VPSVFAKLNLKTESEIVVLNSPESFETELAGLTGISVQRDINKVRSIFFSLAFVTRQADLDALALKVTAKAKGGAVLWFAYPKGSSKKYKCDFNRDTGWNVLGTAGFEAVRQVAIDEDWSALRFRRAEYIKSLQREAKQAMSADGKRRTSSGAADG
jgi:hypothetical protein